jgi:uncharacterized protein (DUF433 family)
VISPASNSPLRLSFWNLVEAHVLRALRLDHAVKLKAVRQAIDFAERELKLENLLRSRALSSSAGELFLDRYGELMSLSSSGQLAMRDLLHAHLKRVEWSANDYPLRLYPWLSSIDGGGDKPIVIDPDIAFGRPVIARKKIGTAAIAARLDAGEESSALARDYGVTEDEIRQAAVYEHAA